MNHEVILQLKKVKEASHHLRSLEDNSRQNVLLALAEKLKSNHLNIIRENQKDLSLMDKSDPKYDRLLLTKERIDAIAKDVELVATSKSPLSQTLSEIQRPNGLIIKKISVPLGVVSVIYESRPNVTIDVFTLCFKTGNACVLKGGKEAFHSNLYLVSLIHDTLKEHQIDTSALFLLPIDRESMQILLTATNLVDVCIPRGSQALIDFVRSNAKIPVIETGAGIVHTYFDESGDLEKGRLIIHNAKTRRISVCNALDTLIIHERRLTDLPKLVDLMIENTIEIYADALSYTVLEPTYPKNLLHKATLEYFGQEFLDYKMSIKTVSSIKEAISHIEQFSSQHSEAIIAEDPSVISEFLASIDAAAVYVNASTAFTDGGQFGMGAEIGISTQKLHARGPMGLEALTSYKWIVLGDGQIRDN